MAHATNDIEAVRMAIALGIVFLVDTIILGVLTILFMIYIQSPVDPLCDSSHAVDHADDLLFSRVIHQRFESFRRSLPLSPKG